MLKMLAITKAHCDFYVSYFLPIERGKNNSGDVTQVSLRRNDDILH